jgi:ATP-dependent RNA helicase RhlE
MSFDQLGLTPELLRAVADQGYTEPTPVQAAAIPLVLAGRDVLAGAQTGTGKTAAFVLPIIQLLGAAAPAGDVQAPATDRRVPTTDRRAPATDRRGPIRVLVVVPTRELALQVEESVRTYGARHRFRSTTIYGGVGFDPQVRALRAGPEIVVATPGRLLDHVGQRTIDLSRVEILVLDEADRMLDMGFIRDIRKILALLPAKRQNLLFSATFSDEIRRLADGFLDRPASVEVARRNTPAELVRQVVHPVDRERKRELLSRLIRTGAIRQALVFTRTKHGASRLSEQLVRDGIAAAAIHGNKSQPQRVRALNDFKAGRVDILVATDIAARGLDIEALPHVVNYELPMVPEDYVHRIGRTGRAGVDGIALSLVCVDEAKLLRDIEGMLGRRVETQEVPGFTPDLTIRPEPIRLRSGEPGHGGFGTARPAGRGAPARPAQGRPIAGGRAPVAGGRSPASAPARMSIGRPMPARPMAAGRPAPMRPSMGRHDPRHDPRHDVRVDPRHGGAARPDVPVERPPWARDAGRVNGERVALPRAIPGERLARLPQE